MKTIFQKRSDTFDQIRKKEIFIKRHERIQFDDWASRISLLNLQNFARIPMQRTSEPVNHASRMFWEKHGVFNFWSPTGPIELSKLKKRHIFAIEKHLV